jgi:CO dehydrogenase/acetyl-CoA synthase alpha subunit
MSAVHQPVLTLVGTAHASSPRKGGRPSEAGLDARQSELAFVVARMWGTSCHLVASRHLVASPDVEFDLRGESQQTLWFQALIRSTAIDRIIT